MSLFKMEKFTSHAGLELDWKVECDALDAGDWLVLASIVATGVGPFGTVIGIPEGGMALLDALLRHRSRSVGDSILVVDDVLTTGQSMEATRQRLSGAAQRRDIKGAVAFARGRCPDWIYPVWTLNHRGDS